MNYEPNPKDYEVVSLLGTCCSHIGIVLLAKHKLGSLVAVKKFDLEKAIDYNDVLQIQKEVVMTRQLQNNYVLSYACCFVDSQSICAVSPLCGYGSCTDLIASHFPNGLPELAICFFLRDVLHALSYLHKKGIIHRSVRASHVLVTAAGKAMLTGLRYATDVVKNGVRRREVHSFPPSTISNLNWLSPEFLEQNIEGYNEKSDIYSLGITAAEMANGCVPFSDVSATLMLTEKVRGCTPQLIDCSTYPTFENKTNSDNNLVTCTVAPSSNGGKARRCFTESFHQLTSICLLKDAVLRPSASQLQNHCFFKQLKQKNVPSVSELLHPVMPLCDESIQSDTDDLNVILANSDKMAEINISNVEWEF